MRVSSSQGLYVMLLDAAIALRSSFRKAGAAASYVSAASVVPRPAQQKIQRIRSSSLSSLTSLQLLARPSMASHVTEATQSNLCYYVGLLITMIEAVSSVELVNAHLTILSW